MHLYNRVFFPSHLISKSVRTGHHFCGISHFSLIGATQQQFCVCSAVASSCKNCNECTGTGFVHPRPAGSTSKALIIAHVRCSCSTNTLMYHIDTSAKSAFCSDFCIQLDNEFEFLHYSFSNHIRLNLYFGYFCTLRPL